MSTRSSRVLRSDGSVRIAVRAQTVAAATAATSTMTATAAMPPHTPAHHRRKGPSDAITHENAMLRILMSKSTIESCSAVMRGNEMQATSRTDVNMHYYGASGRQKRRPQQRHKRRHRPLPTAPRRDSGGSQLPHRQSQCENESGTTATQRDKSKCNSSDGRLPSAIICRSAMKAPY